MKPTSWIAVVALAASLVGTTNAVAGDCHWWQIHCDDTVEGLPADAPREGTVVTIDVSTNLAYLFRDGQLIARSPAATGTGRVLKKGHQVWLFHTPRGHLHVLRKIVDPIWKKPDWAFVEEGKPVPPPDSPKRLVKGHLGKYALDLGEGIMIHGTDDASSIGRLASHGCIRLPDAMLSRVWQAARVGTDVYIFESRPQTDEHHSDLDY